MLWRSLLLRTIVQFAVEFARISYWKTTAYRHAPLNGSPLFLLPPCHWLSLYLLVSLSLARYFLFFITYHDPLPIVYVWLVGGCVRVWACVICSWSTTSTTKIKCHHQDKTQKLSNLPLFVSGLLKMMTNFCVHKQKYQLFCLAEAEARLWIVL